MKEERAEYIQAIRDLDGDAQGRREALEAVAASDIWVHGSPARFPYVPYLFNKADVDFLQDTCTQIHTILSKVIRRYVEDPGYRGLFCFPPEVERLILLPCGYDEMLPMGRFDLFLSEDDLSFKFCEFNTDGSGAMSRDLVLAQALERTPAFARFAAHHKVERFELFDSWVEAFMQVYRSDRFASAEVPNVCVTDFAESGVFSDFNRFIAAFERAGIPARFVDVRAFEFDGERLIDPSDGTQIHAIYRRSVTSEILQHPGECDALIRAVEAGKVCLIGHFRTTVVHSKMVNVALFDERTRAFLTPEECAFIDRTVPRTYRLRTDNPALDLADVLGRKDAWIVKPEDDYGAHGVYPGVDFEQQAWERTVRDNLDAGYIAQEFYQPARVDVVLPEPDPAGEACRVESWQSMPGFYQYNGRVAGLYCRLGQEGVIALDHGGLCSCSFKVDC